MSVGYFSKIKQSNPDIKMPSDAARQKEWLKKWSIFSEYGEGCMFVGIPAVCKTNEIKRIFDSNKERSLDKEFEYIRFKL